MDAEPIAPSADRRALVRQVVLASVGILLFLTILKHLGRAVPPIGRHAFTIAAGVQLYVPILLIGRFGNSKESLGFVLKDWRGDLILVGLLAVATIAPYAIAHHFWQTLLNHRVLSPRLPSGLAMSVLTQVLVVALPEELFFRGYLQGRMEALWPAKKTLFGVPFGKAVLVAAAVFALGHFLGEYRPDRLGPFFPALLFGLLRTKTRSVLAPTLYHAFCNLLSDTLFASYHR